MLNTSNISEEALNDDESAESPSGSAEVLPGAGDLELIKSEQVMSLTWASIASDSLFGRYSVWISMITY